MGAKEFVNNNSKSRGFHEMEEDGFDNFTDSELVYHVRDALNSVSSVNFNHHVATFIICILLSFWLLSLHFKNVLYLVRVIMRVIISLLGLCTIQTDLPRMRWHCLWYNFFFFPNHVIFLLVSKFIDYILYLLGRQV